MSVPEARFLRHRQHRVGEAREHARRHAVLAGELDRADLQHLGAQARHLEHFFESDGVQAARIGHHARIGGVDAVHVGVDLALVGLQRRGQRHRRGIRAAAAERGDVALAVDPLEARDHRHAARSKIAAQARFVDRVDARACVGRIGQRPSPASRCSCAPSRPVPAAPSPAGRSSPARRWTRSRRVRADRAAPGSPSRARSGGWSRPTSPKGPPPRRGRPSATWRRGAQHS